MRLFLHELRTEQLLFWRNREAAFFTFALPIVFFLIFGSVYGDSTIKEGARRVRGAAYLEAGMIGYGIASTARRRAPPPSSARCTCRWRSSRGRSSRRRPIPTSCG